MINSLQQLGLKEKEIKTYLSLHKLGPASIRQVASQSKINRGTTYESLKELVKKGLVAYFPKGKRRYFIAESPKKLITLAKEKRKDLEGAFNKLTSEIIPELISIKPKGDIPQVYYYEGDEGIELILRDLLKTVEKSKTKEYCVYSSKPLRKYLYRFFPNFTKQRVKKKINVKVIALGPGGEKAELAKRKWLNKNNNMFASSYIIIYPPKFTLISLAQEDFPYAVVINEKEVAKTQKLIFNTLWRML